MGKLAAGLIHPSSHPPFSSQSGINVDVSNITQDTDGYQFPLLGKRVTSSPNIGYQ